MIDEKRLTQIKIDNDITVSVIKSKLLSKFDDKIVHGFSTRLGGVSKDHLSSMNLSFSRGDERDNVLENHRRFAKALGYDEKKLVQFGEEYVNPLVRNTGLYGLDIYCGIAGFHSSYMKYIHR